MKKRENIIILFNIGPYDRKKTGREGLFWGAIAYNIYPPGPELTFLQFHAIMNESFLQFYALS